MIQPLWRTVWRFLKKLKIELPYDPGGGGWVLGKGERSQEGEGLRLGEASGLGISER